MPLDIEFLIENNAIEGVRDPVMLNQAKHAWLWLMEQEELTISVVLKLHKLLMLKDQTLRPNERGYLREVPVYVAGKEKLDHNFIHEFLDTWCYTTNHLATVLNPIALHVAYEHIHPFVDGNGRTGRMLLNWTRLKLTDEPLLIIHEGEEQQKYYDWFKR